MSFPARREVERRLLEPPLQDDCWQPQNTPYDFKYEERTFYYLGEREGKSRKAQSIMRVPGRTYCTAATVPQRVVEYRERHAPRGSTGRALSEPLRQGRYVFNDSYHFKKSRKAAPR